MTGDRQIEIDGVTYLLSDELTQVMGDSVTICVDHHNDRHGSGFHVSSSLSSSC